MKKIFGTLVVFCVVSCTIFCAEPVFAACSQEPTEIVTGAACSIKDLNLEKNKTAQEKVNLSPTKERNLRPIKPDSGMSQSVDNDCILGMCLYRNLLEGMRVK